MKVRRQEVRPDVIGRTAPQGGVDGGCEQQWQ
jgi:hypothetical protein